MINNDFYIFFFLNTLLKKKTNKIKFQIHPQQGQTVQVQYLWQGFLPKPYPGCTQAEPHGATSVQVQRMLSWFQSAQ